MLSIEFFRTIRWQDMKRITTPAFANYAFIMMFMCVLIVYGLSFYKRQSIYSTWMENKDVFVVDNVTAMSGNDSYYWLKMADELDAGSLGQGQPEATKGYPDLVRLAINDTPGLLAKLISLSKKWTGNDYYRAGLLLIPILSGLFVFPLFFYFLRLGFGCSAVLGGLIGTFSRAYYDRTTMGRLDTDLLNLFFLTTISWFILLIDKTRHWRMNVVFAACSGLTMYWFIRWYQQPSFIALYLVLLVVYLMIGRIPWKQTLCILSVFLLAAGPEYVGQMAASVQVFLNAYVSPPPASGSFSWPDILGIVAEAQKRGLQEMLTRLHGFLPLVFAGFLGLLYLCIRYFRQMLPVSPLITLGLWSLVGPNRFAMYLAPLIGVGVGVLIELLLRYLGRKKHWFSLTVTVSSLVLMFIVFFSTVSYTAYNSIPSPTVDAATTKALLDIKKIVPNHAAMFTTEWSFGYPLMQIGDFATYHDGSLHGGMRTTLISQSIMSPRQTDIVSLVSYLEDHGFNALASTLRKEQMTAEEMMSLVFNYPEGFKGDNAYVLYLEDTIWDFDAMAYFGTWDYGKRQSLPLIYVELQCFSMSESIINCKDGYIDIQRGVMNDGRVDIPMSGLLFINDGYVESQRFYDRNDGYYVQVLKKKGTVYTTVVADQQVFQSNFNQQFLLGNFDRRYFEEVYNEFPVARLFKVKKTQEITE